VKKFNPQATIEPTLVPTITSNLDISRLSFSRRERAKIVFAPPPSSDNIFLAILLSNFDEDSLEEELQNEI
jgi:hypothetical protein